MGWDLENFQKICDSKGLPDSSAYCKALFWKYSKALLLTDKSRETLELFWNHYQGIDNSDPESVEAFRKAQLEAETYLEAALQNLHSITDILCQIINIVLLQSTLHEANVRVKTVTQELKKREIIKVQTALENLENSCEFKYVAAFVNTIKHRRLLDYDYHGEFGKNKENTMDIRFQAFTYDKDKPSIQHFPKS
ncbi:MAG: hypothetical protein MET45_06610 [Nostoc sp. LLA-1]|nr:hypothetical protein [Cyanocohniella sp. LLY]